MDNQYNNYDYNNSAMNYGNEQGSNYVGTPMRPKKEKKSSSFGKKLGQFTAIALAFGLVAGTVFAGTNFFWSGVLEPESKTEANLYKPQTNPPVQQTSGTAPQSITTMDVSGMVESVMPSIVSINNLSEVEYSNWYGRPITYEVPSCGSGIIVSQDESYVYIATNNHVIEDAKTLTVQFIDESTADAEVKGTAENKDLAVIAVAKTNLSQSTLEQIKVATIGDSSEVQVGETAIAIGNALGYGQSVTTGVISALDREVTLTDAYGNVEMVAQNLIQTDAAINPGNSGGALLNAKGEVIGINSMKYSETGVEGMGYAIPMSVASPIIERLINREVVDEADAAYFGIHGQDISSSVAEAYGMPVGIYIYEIDENSAAAAAGLRQGDIITSFNGTSVSTVLDLEDALQYCSAGSKVKVEFQRKSGSSYEEKSVTVTMGSRN